MCVIIDARHSSRGEIVRDVKASALFENIFEAKSIGDGLKLVSESENKLVARQEVDACILGPSVSLESAAAFFKDARAASVSKDTAFIALVPADRPGKEMLLESGAHRVIEFPCTKKTFSEGIVRGVIAANKDSPWTSIVLRADAENVGLFGDEASPSAPRTKDDPHSLANILRKVTPEMKRLAAEVESGELVPDDNGKPSAQARAAASALTKRLFDGSDKTPELAAFAEYFEESLLTWLLDLRSLPAREASNILHRSLLGWKM